MTKRYKHTLATLITILLSACGGGSSDSGMLIEGTLTQNGGSHSEKHILTKHIDGELIENVKICALGECSITDGKGQWGFALNSSFNGGEVFFTINGHGINATTIVSIPSTANEVFLDLQHMEDGEVKAEHITIDGETMHNENEEHHESQGSSH
jgi:hypothetical protein